MLEPPGSPSFPALCPLPSPLFSWASVHFLPVSLMSQLNFHILYEAIPELCPYLAQVSNQENLPS